MATKESLLVLLRLFFITTGFLAVASGVGAETLKIQVSNVPQRKEEV